MSKHFNFHTDLDQEPYTYTNSCYHCGQENIITIDQQDYKLWKVNQTFVQLVFPELSPEQREILISGTHPECWDEVFPEEDEDPVILDILNTNDNNL